MIGRSLIIVFLYLILTTSALSFRGGQSWLIPIKTLASISKNINSDPITPLLLLIDEESTTLISGDALNSSFSDLLLTTDVKKMDMDLKSVLKTLGLREEQIDEVKSIAKNRNTLVLIDYFADGCVPCQYRKIELTSLTEEYFTMSFEISASVSSVERRY